VSGHGVNHGMLTNYGCGKNKQQGPEFRVLRDALKLILI